MASTVPLGEIPLIILAINVFAGNVGANGVNNNWVSSVGLYATVPAISCDPLGYGNVSLA